MVFSGDAMSSRPGRDMGSGGSGLGSDEGIFGRWGTTMGTRGGLQPDPESQEHLLEESEGWTPRRAQGPGADPKTTPACPAPQGRYTRT